MATAAAIIRAIGVHVTPPARICLVSTLAIIQPSSRSRTA